MKRSIKLVAGLGLAAGIALGAAPAASAHEQKPAKKHGCHHTCTPAPKPPAGGWDCQKDHSCKPPKHPHCPPVKHPHKPPVTQVTPNPPVVSKPRTPAKPTVPTTPVVHRSTPNTPVPQAVPSSHASLPRTGGLYEQGLYGAAGFLLVGSGLLAAGRRGSKWTKA